MVTGMPGALPGGTNTISNASTLSGWLEATGLDDLLATTCGCLLGVQEDPEPVNGARARPGTVTTAQPQRVRRGVVKKPAGKTVDGKELVIEEYPGLFGIAPFFRGRQGSWDKSSRANK